MRAMITGGTGFVGKHLASHLKACGDEVLLTRGPANDLGVLEGFPVFPLDIQDAEAARSLVAELQPELIYHLAAATFVPEAEAHPEKAFSTNVFGTLNFLAAIRSETPSARILYVGSSEVYGPPHAGMLPITESTPLNPASIYGVTKAAADLAVGAATTRHGTFTIRARPFPHTGPGQRDIFAISSFARQVAEIKLGRKEPVLSVGNLNVKRDYTDVRDIVAGYRKAVLGGKSGEAYNFCSGQSHEIGFMLRKLIEVAGVDAEVRQDPARMRSFDIPDIRGSNQKAKEDFGWQPEIPLESTLKDLLDYWLANL